MNLISDEEYEKHALAREAPIIHNRVPPRPSASLAINRAILLLIVLFFKIRSCNRQPEMPKQSAPDLYKVFYTGATQEE